MHLYIYTKFLKIRGIRVVCLFQTYIFHGFSEYQNKTFPDLKFESFNEHNTLSILLYSDYELRFVSLKFSNLRSRGRVKSIINKVINILF